MCTTGSNFSSRFRQMFQEGTNLFPDIYKHRERIFMIVLLVLVQGEYATGMNEVIRPWVSGEAFTPEGQKISKFPVISK